MRLIDYLLEAVTRIDVSGEYWDGYGTALADLSRNTFITWPEVDPENGTVYPDDHDQETEDPKDAEHGRLRDDHGRSVSLSADTR